jgi:hypothetical protein
VQHDGFYYSEIIWACIRQLNSATFPDQLYLPRLTTDNELGPKQITSVVLKENRARSDENPHSNS